MTERVIDLSETPARLSMRNANLSSSAKASRNWPFRSPIWPLWSSRIPRSRTLRPSCRGCQRPARSLSACDDHHLPVGMLLPLQAHFVQTERFEKAGTSVVANLQAHLAATRPRQESAPKSLSSNG